jgi:hypothetical protein
MITKPVSYEFILEVLQLIAKTDSFDAVWWRCDGEYAPITFLVNCNDLFRWATADCEKLTSENLPILKQSIADVYEASHDEYGDAEWEWGYLLFCARIRKLRPQQPAYPNDKLLRALFDAVGPPRNRLDEG